MRILLVEDDDVDAMIIERWLRGNEIVRVRTAAAAMSRIGHDFTAIICDMGLPDATFLTEGVTTVTEILAATKIPLIKVSGRPQAGVIDKTKEAIVAAVEKLRHNQEKSRDDQNESSQL